MIGIADPGNSIYLDRLVEGAFEESAPGTQVRAAYGGSAAMARQIQRGAPASVFLSANPQWMDALETSGDLIPGTRADLLTNRLVVIAHGDVAQLQALSDLPDRLGTGPLRLRLHFG